jgi:FkbM family methyltransferase
VSVALRAIRRLASAPLLNRLTKVTPLLRLSYAVRASLVRERSRFVRNELRRTSLTATYRLRESGVSVTLRHHTGDVMVLDEIFSQREYEFPEPALDILAGMHSPLVVADLGANIGLFGAWLLGRFPDARIVALEADPGNAAVHRRTITANAVTANWQLIEAFAAPAPGRVSFAAGSHATSHESKGEGAIEVEAVDVFEHIDGVDLLKIDVEGSEWPLLADSRFAETGARVVVLEYHADGCPHADPVAAAEAALVEAGYETLPGTSKPAYGAGVLWGLRRSAHSSP